ncbi:MAG: hypothetical protein WC340_12020 [Kiritimatiellia bacterium]
MNNIVKKKAENVKVFAPMSSGLDVEKRCAGFAALRAAQEEV